MSAGKINLLTALAVTAGIIAYIISAPLTHLTPLLCLALAFLTLQAATQWKKAVAGRSSGNWNASFCLRVAATVFWVNLLLCAILSFFETIPCLPAILLLFSGISVSCWGLSWVADRLETARRGAG